MHQMIFRSFFMVLLVSATAHIQPSEARQNIHIVGSSTVYPFATVVAERFGRSRRYKTPIVEATGSGGGMKLFCAGIGANTPDIVNTSRRIKKSEFDRCQQNGVREILELKIGYDGIVFANSVESDRLQLSRRDIYLALAKMVPARNGAKRFVPNPYRTWRDVNKDLPDTAIRVLGPPPTSGTRDAFAELALEGGCKTFDWIAALKKKDRALYKERCHTVRENGAYIEAGENDNLIIQKINADPQAFGIFGFSFLQENKDLVQGALVEGEEPDFATISSGAYPVSRALYFYVKKAHMEQIRGLRSFINMFVNKRAIGDRGYLLERGLIPLNEEELAEIRQDVRSLKSLNI